VDHNSAFTPIASINLLPLPFFLQLIGIFTQLSFSTNDAWWRGRRYVAFSQVPSFAIGLACEKGILSKL